MEQRIAQFSSTMDHEFGPTLSQVGSFALTAVLSVRIRMMETMHVLFSC